MTFSGPRSSIFAAIVLGLAAPANAQDAAGGVPSVDIIGSTPRLPEVGSNTVTFQTLYKFPGGKNSRFPRGGVVVDSFGNVYGTTVYPSNCLPSLVVCGIVYKLKPPNGTVKTWTFSILHEFGHSLQDGIGPTGPLTLVGSTLYGTTSAGADPNCGCGEVFSISTGGTNYKQLYVFRTGIPFNPVHGSTPIAGVLVIGSTIYGTTSAGGLHGAGVLYKLSTSGGGFAVLHHFTGKQNGGPQGELMLGKDGFIYGTQFGGGKYNQGTVFRISKTGSGFQVLRDFKGVDQIGGSIDGANPEGRLAQGSDGTIYGTTSFGGTPSGYGTAWSLKLVNGKWIYSQLRRFNSTNTTREDANLPHSGLVLGPGGVLYGSGAGGGHYQSGALYQLTPPTHPNTPWGYKTLFSFIGRNIVGDTPYGVLRLSNGYLYGENLSGGHITTGFGSLCPDGCGTVFRLKP